MKRDAFRYESFYASPSTVTASVSTRSPAPGTSRRSTRRTDVLWSHGVGGLGYTTPAVTDGTVFTGAIRRAPACLPPETGRELWNTDVGGHVLGSPVVIGQYVFVSTTRSENFALHVYDGAIAWRLPLGKYTPGIATEQTYYFSLNGRLMAFRGRDAKTS